ncbi:hypothetical protein BUE93_20270 [Chromobacterium amazonense]|uniref:ParB-like N-terminal domain-containing protein n=2 Tax=Chromobacterium amazonense TaxID=1382803 RepID=A0A2S9WZ85_9NEIS|nr:hypothetical protein BUE93_20270 [Chromobacterium amazonense]
MIPVDKIDPSPYQPRVLIKDQDVDEKAEDIRANGQLQPIQVRKMPNGRYELIDGEHRWRAMIKLGEPLIRAEVKRIFDKEAALQAISSNLKRKGYSDFELARSIKKVEDESLIGTVSELASFFGCQVSDIYRFRAFFELPKEAIQMLNLSPTMINRVAAEKLKSFFKSHGESSIEIIITAMRQIESGAVPASRIDSWIEKNYGVDKKTNSKAIVEKFISKSKEGQTKATGSYNKRNGVFKLEFQDQSLAEEFDKLARDFFKKHSEGDETFQ